MTGSNQHLVRALPCSLLEALRFVSLSLQGSNLHALPMGTHAHSPCQPPPSRSPPRPPPLPAASFREYTRRWLLTPAVAPFKAPAGQHRPQHAGHLTSFVEWALRVHAGDLERFAFDQVR